MKATSVLVIGAGAWLMYYAVKNKTGTPIKHAQTELKKLVTKPKVVVI